MRGSKFQISLGMAAALLALNGALVACAGKDNSAAPIEFSSSHPTDGATHEFSIQHHEKANPILLNNSVTSDDPVEEDPDLAVILDRAESTATTEGAKILKTGRQFVNDGVIVVGSCWDFLNAVFKKAGATGRNLATPFASHQAGPYADVNLIQAGDWLYFINHSFGDVEHSAVFVAWTDFENKQALMLSYRGGNSHTPGRYSEYDLSSVYNIMRPKPAIGAYVPPVPTATPAATPVASPVVSPVATPVATPAVIPAATPALAATPSPGEVVAPGATPAADEIPVAPANPVSASL